MKKSTKAAIATGAAAVLLMGGAGSLAYWTATTGTLNGGDIEAGSITLTAGAVPAAWSHSEDDTAVVTIVPGDQVYKDIPVTLVLEGDHIAVDADNAVTVTAASIASVSGALNTEITTATELRNGATVVTGVLTEGTYNLTARILVNFPGAAATNASQNGVAALNGLEIVATQSHDTVPVPAP